MQVSGLHASELDTGGACGGSCHRNKKANTACTSRGSGGRPVGLGPRIQSRGDNRRGRPASQWAQRATAHLPPRVQRDVEPAGKLLRLLENTSSLYLKRDAAPSLGDADWRTSTRCRPCSTQVDDPLCSAAWWVPNGNAGDLTRGRAKLAKCCQPGFSCAFAKGVGCGKVGPRGSTKCNKDNAGRRRRQGAMVAARLTFVRPVYRV
jgi:hypothetical protein